LLRVVLLSSKCKCKYKRRRIDGDDKMVGGGMNVWEGPPPPI
jgi:hypothetical protein